MQETVTEHTMAANYGLVPRALAELGQKNVAVAFQLQADMLSAYRFAGQAILDQLAAEAELAGDLKEKLAAGTPAPEVGAVWQEWLGRRMALLMDGCERFGIVAQTFANASAGMLPSDGQDVVPSRDAVPGPALSLLLE